MLCVELGINWEIKEISFSFHICTFLGESIGKSILDAFFVVVSFFFFFFLVWNAFISQPKMNLLQATCK